MSEKFNIRSLKASNWQAFRDIRLEALLSHPDVYGASYNSEKYRSEDDWKKILDGEDLCVIGGFFQSELIGISGICKHRDDPAAETALLIMWYIKPEYRGNGVFQQLAQGCMDWASAQSCYTRVLVAHREGNEASRNANQKLGFNYIGKKPHIWPDGNEADEYFYERKFER